MSEALRELVVAVRWKATGEQPDKQVQKAKGGLTDLWSGVQMLTQALMQLRQAVAKPISDSLQMGGALGQIATLIPESQKRIVELKDEIFDLSRSTGKPIKDISDGMYEVISSFEDTNQTVAITEVATKAAQAGMVSVTEAVGGLAGITKAYGDTSLPAVTKASDLMFWTVNKGKVRFGELAGAIQGVASTASLLGVTQEEMSAIFATATGVTGGGSEVGTQMVSAMKAMLERTPEMEAAFKKVKFSSAQAAIAEHGLVGALKLLMATAGGDAEKMAKMFGRVEGFKLTAALVGGQTEMFTKRLKEAGDVAGTTDEAFDAATHGLARYKAEVDRANARLEVVSTTIGDDLVPMFAEAKSGWAFFMEGIARHLPDLESIGQAIFGVSSDMNSLDDTSTGVAVSIQKIAVIVGMVIQALKMYVHYLIGLFGFAMSALMDFVANAKIAWSIVKGEGGEFKASTLKAAYAEFTKEMAGDSGNFGKLWEQMKKSPEDLERDAKARKLRRVAEAEADWEGKRAARLQRAAINQTIGNISVVVGGTAAVTEVRDAVKAGVSEAFGDFVKGAQQLMPAGASFGGDVLGMAKPFTGRM